MKFLLVPGLPLAALCLGIDPRTASVPPPVLSTLTTFPIAFAVILILCLLMRLARR